MFFLLNYNLGQSQTSRVKHGRETANPNDTTSVIADTAAPANGG